MPEDKAPATGTPEPTPAAGEGKSGATPEPGAGGKEEGKYAFRDALIAQGLTNEAQIAERWEEKAATADGLQQKLSESQSAAAARIGKLYGIDAEKSVEYAKEHGLGTFIDDLEAEYGKPGEKAPETEADAETEVVDPTEKRFKALEAEVQSIRNVRDVEDWQRVMGKALDAEGITDEEDRYDIGRLASAKVALLAEQGKQLDLTKAIKGEVERLAARDKRRWEAREKGNKGKGSEHETTTTTTQETSETTEKPVGNMSRDELELKKIQDKMLAIPTPGR